jgi:uncharacterized protein (TIGR00251 family)
VDEWLRKTADGAEIHVRVRPGARSIAVVGVRNGQLLIDVDAPPHGGKANIALVKLLAKKIGAGTAQVVIVSGGSSRSKVLHIIGVNVEDIIGKLGA